VPIDYFILNRQLFLKELEKEDLEKYEKLKALIDYTLAQIFHISIKT